MPSEETHAYEAAGGVVAISQEGGDGLRIEAIGARTPRALEAEARSSGALVLGADPEGDFVRVQIVLQ